MGEGVGKWASRCVGESKGERARWAQGQVGVQVKVTVRGHERV